MKTKRLLFINWLAAGALITSPSFGKPAKKSTGGYPYSGYNNYYSYYKPTYGYNASLVATVQRCLP